jgi:hypothetical protein
VSILNRLPWSHEKHQEKVAGWEEDRKKCIQSLPSKSERMPLLSDPTEQVKLDVEVFKVVADHFRHNLEIYWQQYLIFIAIQGAFLTVFTADKGSGSLDHRQEFMAGFGILLSALWAMIGWSRWRLIDLWREEVKRLDREVDRHLAFYWVETKVRDRPLGIPAYSSLLVPPIIAIGWLLLLLLQH